jgi:hypothetical protein
MTDPSLSMRNIQLLVLSAIGTADLLLAALAWSRRTIPGGTCMFLLMVALGGWTLTSACEMATISIHGKILWSKISYLFIANIAPLWLLFTIRYTRNDDRMTPRRIALLWVIPAAVLALVATNEWHRFFWSSVIPVSSEPGAGLVYAHGPGVWIAVLYSYILLLTGTILLLYGTLRTPAIFRFQAWAVIGAALVPWAGNILYFVFHFTIGDWMSPPLLFPFPACFS